MQEKKIDHNDMDAAIALGDAVCKQLGICCETRGKVIFEVYQKLQEMHSQQGSTEQPELDPEQLQ